MDKLILAFWAAVDAVASNVALLESRNYLVAGGMSEATANFDVFGGGYLVLGLVFGAWYARRRGVGSRFRRRRAT